MSVEYVTAFKGLQFYCTTSEVRFGPIMPDMDLAEHFRVFLKADPRSLGSSLLQEKWEEFICSGKVNIDLLSPEDYELVMKAEADRCKQSFCVCPAHCQ